jgi:hypothetical protein
MVLFFDTVLNDGTQILKQLNNLSKEIECAMCCERDFGVRIKNGSK